MVKQNLLFQALSLLSQYLTQIKEAKGPLYQKTACLNAEEREMIGLCWATADLIEKEDPELAKYLKEEIVPFIETIGISRWPRTELTDLGLRVGQRHKVQIDLSSDIIGDTDIAEDEAQETSEE
jgi:hypothetical protein